MLLTVEHLRTEFPLPDGATAAAVRDVSFTLDAGRTLGLVGESGSGKSITAFSLINLVPRPGRITGGRVLFDNVDLLTLPESRLQTIRGRRIGFIFQEPMVALNPVYTIGQQIIETLQVHGLARGAQARRRAIEWLDAVSIPDAAQRADAYPHQLSGGLRQRAMIALALCADPSLVIADEPTTALDVTVQAEILDLLRDLRARLGIALLLITHDLGVVAETADDVAVMYGGRIVERGPVADVFAHPAHPYTAGLLACLPGRGRVGEPLVAIPGTVPTLGNFPPGCGFASRCEHRLADCADVEPAGYVTGPSHEAWCHLLREPRA